MNTATRQGRRSHLSRPNEELLNRVFYAKINFINMASDRKALQTELNRIIGHLDSLASELKGINVRFKSGRTASATERDAERVAEIRKQMGLK